MVRLAPGVAAVLAGMTLLTLATAPAQSTFAQAPPCYTPTPPGLVPEGITLTDTATPVVPVCTSTPVIVRTATFTATVTSQATNTPVPPTEAAATNTPVAPAPSATSPSGAPGGTAVQPPNTGSGPGDAGSAVLPLVMVAVALMVGGSGTLALATRRRRP